MPSCHSNNTLSLVRILKDGVFSCRHFDFLKNPSRHVLLAVLNIGPASSVSGNKEHALTPSPAVRRISDPRQVIRRNNDLAIFAP